MKVVGNGVGGKILCENLTVSPKYGSTIKSKFKGRKCVVGKVYPLSKLHESKIGYSESSNMKVVGNGVG